MSFLVQPLSGQAVHHHQPKPVVAPLTKNNDVDVDSDDFDPLDMLAQTSPAAEYVEKTLVPGQHLNLWLEVD